ncbi:hypothetical protein ASPFODRAFT_212700 [Aspergillus luchuensis CBS 106.47]|uniref:Uncharacterized protein n=1 Tax=Aspergillus luchuensis (strain CBS 106.47) TaxID=1137211 RepID=A0A1M3T147_ASPLC|nr:hypothetical protein ASPFODRAFT_212700 [Aspergillus luchuensis CBS 106.47]
MTPMVIQWVSNELSTLLNSILTVLAWKTICQGPLMRDAKNKGVEDLILAEAYLEDPCNACLPRISAGELLSFRDGHPLVFSYPRRDNSTKRALALSEVLFRYRSVHGIRQSQVQEQARKENYDLISYWFNQTCLVSQSSRASHDRCSIEKLKGLHDAVIAAVPLQEPNYQRVAGDKTVHPEGAILVELAVRVGGGPRVLLRYGPVDFYPMSGRDSVVLAQQGEDMDVKRVAAYKDLAARYSSYLCECLRLDPMAKTIQICYPSFQRHPWEVILERGLGDVIREAIPLSLEEHINSQEWDQADLAVDHRGAQRDGQVCELLKCQRFSDNDP